MSDPKNYRILMLRVPVEAMAELTAHLRGLDEAVARTILVGECVLDHEETGAATEATPSLPGWDIAETSTEEGGTHG
jgi:hypothetical protein